jgi:hypothetical protein
LPTDAKLRDIGREIEFLAAIREGEEQADRGEVVLRDQVKKESPRGLQSSLDIAFARRPARYCQLR